MIYLRIVVQVRINILEESAMGVFKVEIYISDQNLDLNFMGLQL